MTVQVVVEVPFEAVQSSAYPERRALELAYEQLGEMVNKR